MRCQGACRPPATGRGSRKASTSSPRGFEGEHVLLQRRTPAPERHGEAVALEGLLELPAAEVGTGDLERCTLLRAHEAAAIAQGVGHADAQVASRLEHPGRLTHRRRHVQHVHERVVGDHQIAAGIGDGQAGGVGQQVGARRVGVPGVAQQSLRTIEPHHPMASFLQVAGHPTFPHPISTVHRPGFGTIWSKKASRYCQ